MREQTIERVRRRRDAFAQERATIFMEHTRELVAPVVSGHVPDSLPGLVPQCVLLWWQGFLTQVPMMLALWVMLAIAVTGGSLLNGMVDALRWTAGKVTSAATGLGHTWESPPGLAFGLRVALALFLVVTVIFAVRGVSLSFPESERAKRERERRERQRAERGGFLPVVVLLMSAARCSRAYQQWSRGTGVAGVPRVSMRSVERVIWRAHKTRYPASESFWPSTLGLMDIGSHHRRVLKAHAAQVVGALRAAEARQDAEPAEALREMAVMLVIIAERYAEGRLGQLLDEDRLDSEVSATQGEYLRFLGLGTAVIAAMTAAVSFGIPSDALGPLLGVVATFGAVIFLRGRIPASADLVDILRGADRR
ncbi:hypothetical protein N4G70_23060 [Streptomyces sp. ASQP_92]|uniref:hypothetical protein n=1 Tax=Streptomyces sp. ASQP_92 TaxID=2979116 RepID=UPI0021C18540|nr:hypothetical protein [Streptomyces sp. ASQP_92]MCT9091729.1 hypothetical protein [Streptomyces sp. ASQP_92]